MSHPSPSRHGGLAAVESSGNLVANGGFESGVQGWMWQQWKGKPLPGHIDKGDRHEGLSSFRLHQDDVESELHLAKEARLGSRNDQDYTLSIVLKPQGMPRDAARVRVLVFENDSPLGNHRIYGEVFLDDETIGSVAVPIIVLPQVDLTSLEPRFEQGRAVLVGVLHRNDSTVQGAMVQLADHRSERVSVSFASDHAAFSLTVRDPATDGLEDLQLVIRDSEGKVQLREDRRLSFVPAVRLDRSPEIDGDLSDWRVPLQGASPAVGWAWDRENLYLAVRVDDPTHIQTEPITQLWKQDSVQIGLAPGHAKQLIRDSMPGLQESEMMEFVLALGQDGSAMYRHRTMNKHTAPVGEITQEQIRHAVRHAAGVTSYELRIPVAQLGLEPLERGMLRCSLLINLDDGRGRKTLEWFGGIVSAKDPNLYGHLLLTDRGRSTERSCEQPDLRSVPDGFA